MRRTVARRRTLEMLESRWMPATITVAPITVETPTSTSATFTATLDAASTSPVTLNYATVNSTARAGRDYTATSGTLTIPAGATSETFSVPLLGTDIASKPNERFYVKLSSGTDSVSSRLTSATIVDNNALPTVDASDLVISPSTTSRYTVGSVPITLSSASYRPVRVIYTSSDVTATALGSSRNYLVTRGVATIKAGSTTGSIRVRVAKSSSATSDTVFNVNLNRALYASVDSTSSAARFGRVVIASTNSAVTRPTLTVANATAVAGSTETFQVKLSAASTQAVSFRYSTSPETATTSQYTSSNAILTIPAGSTSATISVPTTASSGTMMPETFALNISGVANAIAPTTTATGTIISTTPTPPSTPSVSVAGVTATATPGMAQTVDFTVTLSASATSPVTINYTTMDGTAVAGTNYTATSGTLFFAPGETTMTVPVQVLAQASPAASETFNLVLSNAHGATLGTSTATATITGNTSPGSSIGLTVAGATVSAGTTGTATLPFTVTLSAASSSTVTVDYTTIDGSEIAGTDYTAASGTLTFAPGVTSMTVPVTVNGETSTTTKTLSLQISNASNALITSNVASGVISYPGVQPTLAVAGASTTVGISGTSTLSFVVSLSAASSSAVTINYATADGTALAGTDYTAASGTLTFPAGTTSLTLPVTVAGETTSSTSKTLTLNLTGGSGTSNATASATGTINYNTSSGTTSTLTTNLANPSGGTETATGTDELASEFTTGSSSYTLTSATLSLIENTAGTATLEVFSNGGLKPGTLVGTLTSPTTYSTTLASTTFTSSGIALAANTNYWLVLIAPSGSFGWSWTATETGTGTGFVDLWAQSSDSGGIWYAFNSSPLQFSLDATATS